MKALAMSRRTAGLSYLAASLFFLTTGFILILVVRWQLAYPGQPIPLIGPLFAETQFVSGIMLPEFYNQLVGMHGTIMIFLAVVPLLVGAFGHYFLAPMIGAREMAFPKLSGASFWLYLAGGFAMLGSFFVPGGANQSGWTAYPPMAVLMPDGQTWWLLGMLAIGASNVLAAVNFIVTVLHQRAPGAGFFQMPFFVWSEFVAAVLLLLAFPPLIAAAALQLCDRLAGSSFFLPSGLAVNGEALAVSGGGNPVLWQHLFWFLAHPEVYVLILPAFGIVSEVLTTHARTRLHGYRTAVYSTLFLGCVSFLVWAHHMFLTNMSTSMSAFFQITTMIVSIPSVIILTSLVLTLRGGSIRFTSPMLFAIAFLPMFGIGGLTGVPLGMAAADIHLHDTTYVVGHFHYVVAPGTLFAIFAGIYHWFPRLTGRYLNETLGKFHFWGSLALMNFVFFPMLIQGWAGVSRRLYDPTQYQHAQPTQVLNVVMSHSAWMLGLVQLVFIVNLLWSLKRGRPAGPAPWDQPAAEAPGEASPASAAAEKGVPHRQTGLSDGALGLGVFLAADLMLFAALFSAEALLRAGASSWPALDPGASPASHVAHATRFVWVVAWALHAAGGAVALAAAALGRARIKTVLIYWAVILGIGAWMIARSLA